MEKDTKTIKIIEKVFIGISLFWGGGMVVYLNSDMTIGSFLSLIITPIGLLWLIYAGIAFGTQGAMPAGGKAAATTAGKKVKPPTAMELWEMEKVKKQQEEQMEYVIKTRVGEKKETTLDLLRGKKKSS